MWGEAGLLGPEMIYSDVKGCSIQLILGDLSIEDTNGRV